MIHVKTLLTLLGVAAWLLPSAAFAEQQREPLPITPVQVPAAVQEILGGDTSRSHVSSEEGGLVIICISPMVEKRSILKLVRATKALAHSPEFQTYKNLHGWILRLEDERGQLVALFVDAWKVDTLTALSDGDFLMAVQGIYAVVGGHREDYQLFLGRPPHLRVQPDLEKRKRLIEELGLKETAMRQQKTDEPLAVVGLYADRTGDLGSGRVHSQLGQRSAGGGHPSAQTAQVPVNGQQAPCQWECAV